MPSLVPSIDDRCIYFVLCDFGRFGRAYVETDPDQADRDTIIQNLISGQYDKPIRVLAVNVTANSVVDASEEVASVIHSRTSLSQLTPDVRGFVCFHLGIMFADEHVRAADYVL